MTQDLPSAVPGVRLSAPVAGREGCWHATAKDGGGPREVVVVQLPVDPEVREAALAALAPLRHPGEGHRQEVSDLTAARDGIAIVAIPAPGAPVDGLRGLSPGQLVTLGLPMARELAAVHARGLMFGADAPGLGREIVVSPDGRPVLTIGGWAIRRTGGDAPSGVGGAARDCAALVAMLTKAAAPMRGRTEARWERVRGAPDCVALARALRRLARPRPLPTQQTTARTGALPARPTASSRRLSVVSTLPTIHAARRVVMPSLLVLAVVAVAVVGWSSARRSHQPADGPLPGVRTAPATVTAGPVGVAPTSGVVAVAPTSATDWRAVVAHLDQSRGEVFAGTRPVVDVDVPGGAAYIADSRSLSDLRARGLHAQGVLPQLGSVDPVSTAARSVVLAVSDTLPAYHLIDAEGHASAPIGGRGVRHWHVTLANTPMGWRILDVAAK